MNRKALEQTLATVNAEQCELVVSYMAIILHVLLKTMSRTQKELVMQRIRNEEMEGELVRYKLL